MKSSSPIRAGRIPSSESPVPAHLKQKSPRIPKENVDPENPHFRSSPGNAKPPLPAAAKARSPLPPRPPLNPNNGSGNGNPLKRKLHLEPVPEGEGALAPPAAAGSDTGVKVILRMRPPSKDEEAADQIVQRVSQDSVSILDHTFTFDSVADVGSTQQDIFQLVGLPLVENCLAGFNSSIFAYGQTGSGKTYTMWGPSNALLGDHSSTNERGLTPRVFEQLFARIKEEQIKHEGMQLTYQCRCSFLEIYNEQITDLLDPTKRNLQIREDTQAGVYVENLTEDFVCSMKDVTRLLIKGLESRRTSATSINAESSRSHCVFTCIVESQTRCVSNGSSSLRTSRINLVDLAGSERQKQTGAAGERLKEAGNINRSLSQLGNLINILAEISQSGKQRHIPYRDSRLTFLLQDSLGGNAKLAMICAISPSRSCKSETFSTLRFAQRAKSIKNKAVVNEVIQDDVNVLREQIRQLKDELLRMRANGGSTGNIGSFSTGWNARQSLNLLRQSLSRPMRITGVEDDNDEEMEIDDNDVEKPFIQARHVQSVDCNKKNDLGKTTTGICMEVCEAERAPQDPPKGINNEEKVLPLSDSTLLIASKSHEESSHNFLSIVPFQSSPVEMATPSISPRVENTSRKSLRTSLSVSATKESSQGAAKSGSRHSTSSSALTLVYSSNASPKQTNNRSLMPTEHLAANLHRGLQIFDQHQQRPPLRKSSFWSSFNAFTFKPSSGQVTKVDFGMQTVFDVSEVPSSPYICSYCKNKDPPLDYKDVSVDTELQLVPVDTPHSAENSIKQVPKAVEKVLAGAIRREMALEDHCAKQAAEIAHLNRLVQQYKHERECNAIIEQAREDKISRLESLMDGIIPIEHYMEDEFMSLASEHKLLQEKYENHPEVLSANIELKGVQDELDRYRNFFDLGERDVLLEEIQDLRCQLQYYVDNSSVHGRSRGPLLQLTYTTSSSTVDSLRGCSKALEPSASDHPDKLEEERRQWTETESRWISLTEELRVELEAARSFAEKQKLELESEKKCLEELKEAMETAMQSHARILDQYAELEEKHIQLLARHRKIRDGVVDVKKVAAKAGVKGAESRFIDCLAAEISALKAEREKERRYWREENIGLQAQLRDTAEAVQAAGELLVRLKDAEEAAEISKEQILTAEKEAEKARQEIDSLKKKHETEICLLNQYPAESLLPNEALKSPQCEAGEPKYDGGESLTDQQWRAEFKPFYHGNDDSDFSRGAEHHSWFSGYDRCNI